MASKYLLIWNEVKSTGSCTVAMHPRLHSRLVRQLSVVKDRDVGYKIWIAEQRKKARIEYEIEGSRVVFRLRLIDLIDLIDIYSL